MIFTSLIKKGKHNSKNFFQWWGCVVQYEDAYFIVNVKFIILA